MIPIGTLGLAVVVVTQGQTPAPSFCLRVDSSHRQIELAAGPFRIPVDSEVMPMQSGGGRRGFLVKRFSWPLTTPLRGFQLELWDGEGRPLPRSLVHHLYLLDFTRRELVYPMVQRLLGVGRETPDISLPRSIAVPLPAGEDVGLYVMWSNETGAEISDARLVLRLRWAAPNLQPRPLAVLPFFADVHPDIGGFWTFSVPPGGGTTAGEFTLPVSGHVVIAGGHLHDHGVALRLEDAETDRVLAVFHARRDSIGHVLGVERKAFAVRGEGLFLQGGRRYRLVAVYDNPTADTLSGVMGTLAGLFAPSDSRGWPAVDATSPEYRTDLTVFTATLPEPRCPAPVVGSAAQAH